MTADYLALATSMYQDYIALLRGCHDGLGGSLVLVAGLDKRPGVEESTVRAANIAGAATLLIEPDHVAARQCVRSGMCDFLVTNLDEALRILKNELRRKQSAAVCLLAEAGNALEECVLRGVQPRICALGHEAASMDAAQILRR